MKRCPIGCSKFLLAGALRKDPFAPSFLLQGTIHGLVVDMLRDLRPGQHVKAGVSI